MNEKKGVFHVVRVIEKVYLVTFNNIVTFQEYMDFSSLKAGETDPYFGKKIKELILSTNYFIVFIDENNTIQWATGNGHNQYGNRFGIIQNQISYWESISKKVFSPDDAFEINALLAEGYARMLNEGDDNAAQEIINTVSNRIKAHGEEIYRQAYLKAGVKSFMFALLTIFIFVTCKYLLTVLIGENIYDICLAGLFGSIGAFVSMLINSRKYNPEITIGKNIHQVDGALRIILGFLAGSIILLGIKSNMIFGFINEITNKEYAGLFLSTIGGASEVLLPNIIKNIEEKPTNL